MSTFFAMGGYAKWVWSAFGFTSIVIIFNLVSASWRVRAVMRELSIAESGAGPGDGA